MTCRVEGCARLVKARLLCPLHYSRWQRTGHTDLTRPSPVQRFESKYRMDAAGCWLWVGSVASNGYGQFSIKSYPVSAHRWSYEHFIGLIPEGMVIDHLCRTRACVNPLHLEPVTQSENVARSPIALATINAAKTHCPRGHEYNAEHTHMRVDGARDCRTCRHEFKHGPRGTGADGVIVEPAEVSYTVKAGES